MAKSRVEKNKKLYEDLEKEMKNNKGDLYEEKLKSIDPSLDKEIEISKNAENSEVSTRKNEVKNTSALTVIAKEINGKKQKKNELVKVKERKVQVRKQEEIDEELLQDPISFTDKLSVEEILRAKLEQQEKLKNEKKDKKRSPFSSNYTPEMMQERIKQHEGVDVRKETSVITKDYRGVALGLLVLALIAVIVIGALLIFKVIKI